MKKVMLISMLAGVSAFAAVTVPDTAPLVTAVESGAGTYLDVAFKIAAAVIPALWAIGALSLAFKRR